MRLSPLRHTLAVLRMAIGFTQKEMAVLAECSTATIQAIELGKLKLSEKLGQSIARKTGASMAWLMANDTALPAVDEHHHPIDKSSFEAFRATALLDEHPDLKLFNIMRILAINEHRLKAVCLRAFKNNALSLCAYRLAKCFDDLEKTAGVTEEDNKDLTESARAMRNPRHRQAGIEMAAASVPAQAPYYATIHAIGHRDAKGNQKLRLDVWNRLKSATKGFFVHGERQPDGRIVWTVERNAVSPTEEAEQDKEHTASRRTTRQKRK